MIFVTVGTDTHDFSRLLEAADAAARGRGTVMQTGHSRYQPRHARSFPFASNAEIALLYRKAKVIVTHAGAGSIIAALAEGKVPVVVPRRKALGEHVDDHQLDLARFLAAKGKVVLVEDVAALAGALKARSRRLRRDPRLVRALDRYLRQVGA
ncbi:MAG: beta-1,4-galactosyltransferase [Candidatus Aenigmarchaeota archaeon]|nr:beta-1,4-galactosyltransferase [Candidatus Aenigmarchaeota archaeon]